MQDETHFYMHLILHFLFVASRIPAAWSNRVVSVAVMLLFFHAAHAAPRGGAN
jgi:hypothetical protein